MNIKSCDNCGLVIDQDNMNFPDAWEGEEYQDIENYEWDGDGYAPTVPCPGCRSKIQKDESLSYTSNHCVIKNKYDSTFKCDICTGIFEINAMDNCTGLHFCPNCGRKNANNNTINIF